ncbi:MAG TPA: CNNM domain-containing protein, partial [Sedimentisphaerales bacterium]|nr:CNNM domain-containing protein [Sedimentisphaerales bacterium]
SATVTLFLISNNLSEYHAKLCNSFITTPAVLVLGEVIPKNLFFYRANILMPALSPAIWFFHRLFKYSGLIPALKFIASIASRLTGSTMTPELAPAAQRHQLHEIIKETREEGFLSSVQTTIMTRLANIRNIHLDGVMVPLAQVQMLEINTSRATLLEQLKTSPYTRMPVYEQSRDNIIGYVEVYKALCSDVDFADLRKFVRPITVFHAADSVIEAINRMRRENHKMVLVSGPGPEAVKPMGIVTMKDLVEELTGELAEW